mgnify:CR=1 FL=1
MTTKQKILIVDDDENIAELLSLYLTKECFDTQMVYDGEEALRAFDSYQPNLILLDLMLPGIDGYQVCREIRSRSNVPIIMLSAKGEVFDKVLGLELGADDYIIKPFDSKELVARVKSRSAPVSAGQTGDKRCFQREMRRISWHFYQPDELLCRCRWTARGYASKGAGAFVFPCSFSESSVYKRTASRSDLGIRIHRRHPDCGCPHQTSSRKRSKIITAGVSVLSGESGTSLR